VPPLRRSMRLKSMSRRVAVSIQVEEPEHD
jgi:hypothetical protein